MRAFRDLSIRPKLQLIIMITVGAALVMACGIFLTCDVGTFRNSMRDSLATLAEVVEANSAASLSLDDPRPAQEILESLRAEPHIISACLYTREGKLFAAYVRADERHLFRPPKPQPNANFFESGRLKLFHEIMVGGRLVGTVYLESDLRAMDTGLRRCLGIAVLAMLASSILALLLCTRLQRVISLPVLHLAEAARSFAVRASPATPAEGTVKMS